MRLHILETLQPELTQVRVGRELPVSERPPAASSKPSSPYVVPRWMPRTPFRSSWKLLRQEHIRSFCVVPLTTAQRRLGAMGFGKIEPHHYDATKWISCSRSRARWPSLSITL